MKIDITHKDPYEAVVDVIRELTKENGYECMFNRIVRIKTTVLGESNEYLGVSNNDYYWENDWYEGGEVELIGFIDVDKIKIPVLTGENDNKGRRLTDAESMGMLFDDPPEIPDGVIPIVHE